MKNLKKTIQNLSEKYFDDAIKHRRHIHQHPELSFMEEKTAEYIEEQLKLLNISSKRVAKTGVVGFIEGMKGPGKRIALRADTDALPIQEKTGLEFQSSKPGVMHACGHDAHAASLLITAKIVKQLEDHFAGSVILIFQPAEEKLPGGAKAILESGILHQPKVDFILGQHILPDMPAGNLGFKEGSYMASSDEIYITLSGKGGHAALRDKTKDTIKLMAQLILDILELNNLPETKNIPTVLSIGKVDAPGATNVIPGKIQMEGTFRTMNEEWRGKIHKTIQNIISKRENESGIHCDLNIVKGYPVLVNHSEGTRKCVSWAKEYLGDEKVQNMEKRMTAEDFAWYTREIPGTFYRFGVKSKRHKEVFPLHHPKLNIDEEALRTSSGTMAYLCLKLLNDI